MARKTINRQVIKETARRVKVPESKVIDVIDSVSSYIARGIASGSLDSYAIPYFGKFEGKLKQAGVIDRVKGQINTLNKGNGAV